MIKRLPDLTMIGWSFDSGHPVARALVGVPLLLFNFDPVWSRVPYAAVTLLALFYMARYIRLITGFFGREESGPRGSEGVRDVSLIATVLLIAVSPTSWPWRATRWRGVSLIGGQAKRFGPWFCSLQPSS
jgi:hypothetical protein